MTGRPAIVIVTERQLVPVSEGTRARIVTLIRSLRALGFLVVLVTRRPSGRVAAVQMRWLADRLVVVDSNGFGGGSPSAYDCTPFFGPLRSVVERFGPVAVIAEYLWMAPCLDAVDNGALRFVDTIDLMHLRWGFRDQLSNVWVTCTPEEERRLLEKADVVIAIQSQELRLIRELVPDRDVICVPHHVSAHPTPARGNRPVVAVVGSGNPGNVEGLTSFLDRAWPVVRRQRPGAELRVFGELAGVMPPREGVIRVGYARSLRRAYWDAAVVINPVRVGTGLKIKTVEALAHGKAVVTTSCGAEGLESGAGRAFLVEDDMERFGHAVAGLLAKQESRARLESAAVVFAQAEFSRERVFGGFLEALASRRIERRTATPRTVSGSSLGTLPS